MKKYKLKFWSFTVSLFIQFFTFSQTLNLTGSPQYVTIGDLDITGNQITIEALVKFTGGVNIVSKHTNPTNVNYLMRIGTFEITTSQQFYLMSNPYAGSMQPNTWYHVAGTYDGSFIRYYVNGCLIIEQPATGTIVTNNFLTAIGNQSGCSCEQFNGEIDELRIWNVARPQADIAANMFNLSNPTTQTGLLAYYKFDGNLTNAQGNATYNGTWVGTPSYGTQPSSTVIAPLAIQTVTTSDVSCFGFSDGEIAVTASGSNLSYSLDGTTWQTSNQFLNLSANNYTVYVRSQEGCILTSANVSIAQPTQLVVQTTPSPLTSCISANGSVTANTTGGTPGYTYSWTPNLGSGATISNLTAGNYALQVTDQNGCQANANAIVAANNTPQLTVASSTNVTCSGLNNGTATLQTNGGTAPYTYNWVPTSIGNINNPTNLAPGNYTATVTDAGSCTSTVSFSITAPTPLVVTETISNPPCGSSTGSISLAVSGGSGTYTYSWNPATISGNAANNLSGGDYSVTVTDGNGCFVTENYEIVPTGDLGLTVSPTSFLFNIGDTVTLTANSTNTNGVVISWAPNTTLSCDNCNNPQAFPTSNQTYIVYATSADGCVDSLIVPANIIVPCTEIFVPTIFSPNGDGNNDVIGVFGNCIQELEFVILNRWGQVVFKTTSQGETWDGYLNGKMAINDTYVYKLSIVDPTGKKTNTSGNITLIR